MEGGTLELDCHTIRSSLTGLSEMGFFFHLSLLVSQRTGTYINFSVSLLPLLALYLSLNVKTGNTIVHWQS